MHGEKKFEIKREDLGEIVEINALDLGVKIIYPHVIEPSFGIGRIMYTILEHNFKTRKDDPKKFVTKI